MVHQNLRASQGLRASRNIMLLAASLVSATSAAHAQDTAGPSPAGQDTAGQVSNPSEVPARTADEILVTAQFRSQSIQSAPLAITAISGDLLEERGQSNLSEIAGQAPNVTLQPSGQFGGPSTVAYIRGIGQNDPNFAQEPGVGIYIDDVYFGTVVGSLLDLVDLDRVEILRGPQGTLAGMNSIGGAIKLYSRTPGESQDGTFEATYGSRNLYSMKGAAGFTLVPDSLYLRVSGLAQHQDGYVDRYSYGCEYPASGIPRDSMRSDCKIGTQGAKNRFAGRARLLWHATQNVDVDLVADLQLNRDEAAALTPIVIDRAGYNLPPVAYCDTCSGSNALLDQSWIRTRYSNYEDYKDPISGYVFPNASDADSYGFSGKITVDLGGSYSLTSITAYRNTHAQFAPQLGVPFGLAGFQTEAQQKQWTQELRLNGSVGDILDYTVGGYYFKGDARQRFRVIVRGLFDFLGDDPVNTRSKAAFGQATVHILDGLDFIGGLRYTDERKSYTFLRKSTNGGFLPLIGAVDGVSSLFKGNRLDYRANLSYNVAPDVLIYAQYATGFKGGGTNPRPFYVNQVAPFGEETVESFEAGFKSRFFDRRVTLNGAAFYSKYRGIQLVTVLPFFNEHLPVQNDPTLPLYNPDAAHGMLPGFAGTFPAGATQNAGDGHYYGVELEAVAKPIERLTIDGSVSYIKFQYDRLNPGAVAGGITLDARAPYTPKWKASLGVQYDFPLGAEGHLTPRVDVTYRSSLSTDARTVSASQLPSLTLVNARLGYSSDDSHWEASVYATNLLNKFYYYSVSDQTAAYGIVTANPAPPREIGVSFKRNF